MRCNWNTSLLTSFVVIETHTRVGNCFVKLKVNDNNICFKIIDNATETFLLTDHLAGSATILATENYNDD